MYTINNNEGPTESGVIYNNHPIAADKGADILI